MSAEPVRASPRIIIHGGAGSINPRKLPPTSRAAYIKALHRIILETYPLLKSGATALDAATHAVVLLENCDLFNCSHGAVFTRAGTVELEASIMVSGGPGSKKRAVGVSMLKHVKNPIKLAREILIRGDQDMEVGFGWLPGEDGVDMDEEGCAGGHVQLCGEGAEALAKSWGLEMVDEKYFFTERRWNEHLRGLERQRRQRDQLLGIKTSSSPANAPESTNINPEIQIIDEPLPQGTVGCVCLDEYGHIAVATSTGGLTNKLPGRIGDTPTVGAGFWAETFPTPSSQSFADPNVTFPIVTPADENLLTTIQTQLTTTSPSIPTPIKTFFQTCIPSLFSPTANGPSAEESTDYSALPQSEHFASSEADDEKGDDDGDSGSDSTSVASLHQTRLHPRPVAVALSGTGNGDTFLRLAVARTCASLLYPPSSHATLSSAVTRVCGPKGLMQSSAGSRWGRTGEGEGGIIGIAVDEEGNGECAFDFNSGGMWRAWVDEDGHARVGVFRGDDDLPYEEQYDSEGFLKD